MVPCTALHLHSRAPCALPAPHRGSPIRALRRLSRMGCLAPPPPPLHLAALLFRAPRRLSVSGASGPGALHPAVHTAALLSTHCGAYTACGALRHPCTSRLSPHVVPCITPAPRDSPIPRTAAPIRGAVHACACALAPRGNGLARHLLVHACARTLLYAARACARVGKRAQAPLACTRLRVRAACLCSVPAPIPHVVPCTTPAPRGSPIPHTAAPIREWCCTRLRLCPAHDVVRIREAGSSATRLYTLAPVRCISRILHLCSRRCPAPLIPLHTREAGSSATRLNAPAPGRCKPAVCAGARVGALHLSPLTQGKRARAPLACTRLRLGSACIAVRTCACVGALHPPLRLSYPARGALHHSYGPPIPRTTVPHDQTRLCLWLALALVSGGGACAASGGGFEVAAVLAQRGQRWLLH
jgi:hypothetical protein